MREFRLRSWKGSRELVYQSLPKPVRLSPVLQAGTGDMGKHPLGLLQAGKAGQPDGIDAG